MRSRIIFFSRISVCICGGGSLCILVCICFLWVYEWVLIGNEDLIS